MGTRYIGALMTRKSGLGSTVLILSTDALTSALLSIFAELEGYTLVFASADEEPSATLASLRPRLVLVDGDHLAACTDDFFDVAHELDLRTVIFSPGRMRDDVRAFAEERSLPWFSLPIGRADLATTLRSALTALLPFALLATFPH